MIHPLEPRAIEAAARAMIESTSGPFEMLDQTGKEAARFEARAAVTAYLAQQEAREGVMVWQPIETAPKDGGPILVHCAANGCIYAVFWDWTGGDDPREYTWHLVGGGPLSFGIVRREPTSWRELPEPPANPPVKPV